MITIRLKLCLITENVGPGKIGQALFFPEFLAFDNSTRQVADAISVQAAHAYRYGSRRSLWQRAWRKLPEVEKVQVILEPEPRQNRWLEPLTFEWPILRYAASDKSLLAFVPALGIEILADSEKKLLEQVPGEIVAALRRQKHATLGLALANIHQRTSIKLHEMAIDVKLPTPREAADKRAQRRTKTDNTLARVTTELHRPARPVAFEVDALLTQLAEALAGPPGQSVLLVGPSGVGKSALARELARQRNDHGLADASFYETSGSRLVAGMSGFGMWQERCLALCKALITSPSPAFILLGNLLELMEVGKSAHNPQGLATFFHPYLHRGQIHAITECTPEQLQIIERREPRLLEAFTQIEVPEPDERANRKILELATKHDGSPRHVTISPAGFNALTRLHKRYAGYSTNPGRSLRFLGNLLACAPDQTRLEEPQIISAFSQETGLPRMILDDALPLDLAQTRDWFATRVIGQAEPVEGVVEAISRVKSRLTRPGKPIASFLFIGPTGVGKTETAKALAEFLFSAPDRLIRVDMSEYSDPGAAGRLVGIGLGQEGYLTSRVREQPFSVVLLDEFEKADGAVFDLLLQVLGEGRLTDANGRRADFSNSVIIMTSNLGAHSYQRGSFGFAASSDARASAARHFTEEVRAHLRPELFNRIDNILAFAPLDEETALKVTRREIELARKRDGLIARRVTLNVHDDAVRYLARIGYDVRYGARPLKRAIEQHLLAPLAVSLNQYPGDVLLDVSATLRDQTLHIDARAIDNPDNRASEITFYQLISNVTAIRRETQKVQLGEAYLGLQNDLFRTRRQRDVLSAKLEKLDETSSQYSALLKKKGVSRESLQIELLEVESKLRKLEGLINRADDTRLAAEKLEDAATLAICHRQLPDLPELTRASSQLEPQWNRYIHDFYLQREDAPERLLLVFFGEDRDWLHEVARMYLHVIPTESRGALAHFFAQSITTGVDVVGKRVKDAAEFLAADVPQRIGFGIEVLGLAACARVAEEQGLHCRVDHNKNIHNCAVEVHRVAFVNYEPPAEYARRGALIGRPRRRTYDLKTQSLQEPSESGLSSVHEPFARQLGPRLERLFINRAREYAGLGAIP